MSGFVAYETFEVDLLNVAGGSVAFNRVKVVPEGRTIKQLVVAELPPGVELSLHFGPAGRPCRALKQGDTWEFFDDADRSDGVYLSTPIAYPGYVLELDVFYAVGS